MTFNNGLPNYRKAELLEQDYSAWKSASLEKGGYFPVFNGFKEEYLLKNLSGNAIKMYLYLGLHSGNETGTTWVGIETIAKYFDKSPRTISYWLKELEEAELIVRMQMEKNGVSYTFLRPYEND
ncbi:helix-turn-helix domain-containing protein [Pseudogracilibacillus auburnensis]|uniref:helix-turn-helix domain-containing protein n=1 Tax=Pseudogracilibacillus auburnensis TaxID=1494959 RepID=UPI001A96206B|nr:helix-turn-helix domain-containing protein [Pseudogracilibacillus auburnensis]MBO1005917.1 helix-turn-helix domain-containing protein [Pseudogracilibacillus auburnensis]